jgi:hypothetical protein
MYLERIPIIRVRKSNLVEMLCHMDTMDFLIYLCDIKVILISTDVLLEVGFFAYKSSHVW